MRGQRIEDRGQISGFRFQMTEGRLAQSLATVVPLASRGRRGITLLEVLISIFVMAVGLMGVAALIPIGTFAVSETAKADRSAAMGRAAMHEVRVRDMLQRFRPDGDARWYFARNGFAFDSSSLGERIGALVLAGQPFAIDPMLATEATVQRSELEYNLFPFMANPSDPLTFTQLLYFLRRDPRPMLPRLRLDIFENSLLRMSNVSSPPYFFYGSNDDDRADISARQLAVFDRIFAWQDDLIFDIDEDDPDRRPRQSCLWDDVNNSAAPSPPRDDDDVPPSITAANTPLHAQAADNYSWMLTAVPDPNELPNTNSLSDLSNHRQRTYEVSIVTFYKRDFNSDASSDPPSERFVRIDFAGTGIGGGDAVLRAPTAVTSAGLAEEYLKVKENQWIMVTVFVPDSRLDIIFGGFDSGRRKIAKWYRVIRLDDEVQGSAPSFTRNITLAGPDWDDTVIEPGSVYATLIDGVIGVYTTTVTLE